MQKKGSSESKEGKDANPPPVMNTLKVELLSNGKYNTILPNAREPAPFETDFFKGVSMLVVRTAPIDDHYAIFFEGKRRLFEVQVQGKFKRLPQGEIYVGAEASIKMELGLITRSIARAAISLCSSMVGDLHSSLGDNKNGELFQLPHLVAPMFITFDKIILTAPGETPPPLGVPFVEDLEYRKKRLKFRNIKDANVDLETTYSFSVNTSNINLLNWTLVGIPMVKPMDLRTFIQDSAIRLVGYEIPTSVLAANNGDHPLKQVNYVFNMNLTSVDPACAAAVVDLPTAHCSDDDDGEDTDNDNENELEEAGEAPEAGRSGRLSEEEVGLLDHQEPDLDLEQEVEGEVASSESEFEEDAAKTCEDQKPFQGKRPGAPNQTESPRRRASAKGVSGWIRKHIGRDRDRDREKDRENGTTAEAADLEVAEVGESSEYTLTDYEMESTGDLAYCPGCLEMIHEGRRRVLYFIPLPDTHERNAVASSGEDINQLAPRLRPFSEIAKVLPLVPIPRMHKNKRLSSLEKRRRQVVESYRVLMKSDPSSAPYGKFMAFLNQVTPADRDYLEGNASVQNHVKLKSSQEVTCWEGCVGMATSRRHWIEYHLVLSRAEACFYSMQHNNRASQRVPRRPTMRINMSQVVSVQPMRFQDIPLQGFSFFQVETFSRVFYFMVRSDIQLHEWIEAFVSILGKDVLHSPFDESYYAAGNGSNSPGPVSSRFTEPDAGAYLAKSACWRLDKKRIFNYRRIIFNPAAISSKYAGMSPNAFIETILANVLFLSNADANKTNAYQWVKFMDEISWLQTINVSKLSETERVAFFLNLYHVMVLHGSLVVGPPPAWNYWNAFFNNITYLFGYEIISIADVEHNILRASMARPSSLSIIPIPQHQFPGLAVTERDFRMDFCINNGSKSMPGMVPIYSPDYLDELLDEMTALMLLSNVEIDLAKKSIHLPKVSLQDFTTRKAAAAGQQASPMDCLRTLMQYFAPEDRALATRIINENMHVNIRFKSQSLRCRKLRVYKSKLPSAAIAAVAAATTAAAPPPPLPPVEKVESQVDFDLMSGSEFLVDMYQDLVK